MTRTRIKIEDHLLPYQREWLRGADRFKIGLWARQTGKDFTATAEAVDRCWKSDKQTWLIVAAGERQALESLEKAKEWAELFQINIEAVTFQRKANGAMLESAELHFSNGSRILALPARPQTVRGYSGNVILTEFAFHDDPRAIWRAIYPSISNPLRTGQKRLRIITTPNGPGNLFHELWTKGVGYVKSKVTIHEAVAQGLKIDVEALRRGLNDAEGWAQEYECEFLDGGSVLLPYDLIETCETSEEAPNDSSELYAGIDFGRKRDRTVCWVLQRSGDVLWTREVLVLEKMATPQQIEALRPRLKEVRRAAVDYTGAGIGLGDHLAQEFGAYEPGAHRFGKIDLCQISAAVNCELYSKLRMAFERRGVRIPSEQAVREDLHGVRRNVTASGAISYRASHSEDGHSDRCSALALALRAAGEARPAVASVAVASREGMSRRAMERRVRVRG